MGCLKGRLLKPSLHRFLLILGDFKRRLLSVLFLKWLLPVSAEVDGRVSGLTVLEDSNSWILSSELFVWLPEC